MFCTDTKIIPSTWNNSDDPLPDSPMRLWTCALCICASLIAMGWDHQLNHSPHDERKWQGNKGKGSGCVYRVSMHIPSCVVLDVYCGEITEPRKPRWGEEFLPCLLFYMIIHVNSLSAETDVVLSDQGTGGCKKAQKFLVLILRCDWFSFEGD